jgi:hypothetical protein
MRGDSPYAWQGEGRIGIVTSIYVDSTFDIMVKWEMDENGFRHLPYRSFDVYPICPVLEEIYEV